MSAPTWVVQRERGSAFSKKLILWIALHLGRTPARLLLYPITLYFLLTAPAQRQASRDYLSAVFDRPARWFEVARHIHTFAATILDRVFLLSGRAALLDVTIHNADRIRDQLGRGGGALLMGSHLGSFEVLRAMAIAEYDFPLKVLMHREHNEVITRILESLNPQVAESVIPLGGPGAVLRINEALAANELVGLLGDRVKPGESSVPCRFLGREARFPVRPLLLAARLQVPVFLFFGVYRGGNRYDIHFELFADRVPVDPERRNQLPDGWVQRYADRLEYHARNAPYNWFNFYDFWSEEEAQPPLAVGRTAADQR